VLFIYFFLKKKKDHERELDLVSPPMFGMICYGPCALGRTSPRIGNLFLFFSYFLFVGFPEHVYFYYHVEIVW
jgi:hypothetical protein